MKMENLNEMLDNIVQRIDDEGEAQGVEFAYLVWVVDPSDGRGDLRNNGEVDALLAMSVMAQHKLCHELEEAGCIRKVEAEMLSIDEVHAATLKEEEMGIRELPTPAEQPWAGHPNRWGPEFEDSPCGSCGHNNTGDMMDSDKCADLKCEGDFSKWIPPPADLCHNPCLRCGLPMTVCKCEPPAEEETCDNCGIDACMKRGVEGVKWCDEWTTLAEEPEEEK
jgi:hypothetical protein